MLPRIKEARYVANHTVWLRFSDGAEGEVDLTSELYGEVLSHSRHPSTSRAFASILTFIRWCGQTALTSRLSFSGPHCALPPDRASEPT